MNPIKSAGLMAYRLSEGYHDWPPCKVTIFYVDPQTGVNLHAVLPKLPWLQLQSESHVESTLHLMVATIDASGR